MKKFIAIIALVSVLSLAGCGKTEIGTKNVASTPSASSEEGSAAYAAQNDEAAELFYKDGYKPRDGLKLLLPKTNIQKPVKQIQERTLFKWTDSAENGLADGAAVPNLTYSVGVDTTDNVPNEDRLELIKKTELSEDKIKFIAFSEGKTSEGCRVEKEEKISLLGGQEALRISGYMTKKDEKSGASSDDWFVMVIGEYNSRSNKADGKINYFSAISWTSLDNDENKAKINTLMDNFAAKLEYTDEPDEEYYYGELAANSEDGLFYKKRYDETDSLLVMIPATDEEKNQYHGDDQWSWNITPEGNTGMDYFFKISSVEKNSDKAAQIQEIKNYIYAEDNYGGIGLLGREMFLEDPHNIQIESDETVTLGGTEFCRQTGTLEMNASDDEPSAKLGFVTYFTFFNGLSQSEKEDDFCYLIVFSHEDSDECRANAETLARTAAEELCYNANAYR